MHYYTSGIRLEIISKKFLTQARRSIDTKFQTWNENRAIDK